MNRLGPQRLGRTQVRHEDGESTPRESEPEIGVEAAPTELQRVRGDEERSRGDERQQPERPRKRGPDPDRDRGGEGRGGEPDEHAARDLRAQRAAVQLVECVGADAEGEQERREPPEQAVGLGPPEPEPPRSPRRRGARACRAGGAASRSRASRPVRAHRKPAAARRSFRRPHTTTPPPRLSRRARMSASPASDHSSSWRSSGRRASRSRMLGPRKRPTSCQPGESRRPAVGSTIRT